MKSKDANIYLPILKLFVVNMIYNIVYIIKGFFFSRMDVSGWITYYTRIISKVNVANNFYFNTACKVYIDIRSDIYYKWAHTTQIEAREKNILWIFQDITLQPT